MISLNIHYFLTPHTATLRVRTSTYEFEGGHKHLVPNTVGMYILLEDRKCCIHAEHYSLPEFPKETPGLPTLRLLKVPHPPLLTMTAMWNFCICR